MTKGNDIFGFGKEIFGDNEEVIVTDSSDKNLEAPEALCHY